MVTKEQYLASGVVDMQPLTDLLNAPENGNPQSQICLHLPFLSILLSKPSVSILNSTHFLVPGSYSNCAAL